MLRWLLVVVLAFFVWVPTALAWSWPVDGPVLQPFAYDVSHPYAAGQHRGIDIGADSAGVSVSAPASGTVTFAGSVPTSGNCVTIETPDGYHVTLTHLGSIGVAKGATVDEGDVVGTVGPSGTPELDRPYVHLGIRLTTDPLAYVDPLELLPAVTPDPAPASDSDSAGSSAPAAASPPPASTAPPPAPAPAAPADPAPATPVPEPIQADPVARAGDPRFRSAGRRPAPPRSVPTASREVGDLTGSVGRTGDGKAEKGDSGKPGTADQASHSVVDPVGTPGKAAPRHAHSPRGHASGAPTALPAVPRKTWANAGRRPRTPVSEPSASRPQRPATPSPLSLVLGAGPGLLALLVALAAFIRRARRHATASAAAGAAVIHLPRRRSEQRRERRAA